MSPARRHRRLTAWVALVAMLAFALVPTFSRALGSASGGGTRAEVCTPQGVQWLSDDGDPVPMPPSGAQPSLDHCSFCQLATEGAAPIPDGTVAIALPLTGAAPPALVLHAPVPLFAWRSAQPRGPPARS